MKSFRLWLPALALAGIGWFGTAAAQTTHEVTVGNNFFSPGMLTIQVGDTVRWVNPAGGPSHNVTSNTGAWTPSQTASSFTFEVTFNEAGTFDYTCTIHPGMDGTIVVEDGGGASPELEMVSVDLVGGVFALGKDIDIRTRVKNNCQVDIETYEIGYYLSTDTEITTDDLELKRMMVPGPDIGETITRTDSVRIPNNLPSGDYYVGAIILFDDTDPSDNAGHDPDIVNFVRVSINAGLNDAWFNAATAGQGFFFNVFPDIELFFLAWFTFDTERPDPEVTAVLGEPGHRWVTAIGTWQGRTVTLDAELTTGGVFDSEEPEPVQTPDYGTITIVFHDCNNATLSYDFPSLGLSGQIELTRVTNDNVALCEALSGG